MLALPLSLLVGCGGSPLAEIWAGMWQDDDLLLADSSECGPPLFDGFVEITVSDQIACALTDDGWFRCWGERCDMRSYLSEEPLLFASSDDSLVCEVSLEGEAFCRGRTVWDSQPQRLFSRVIAGRGVACGLDLDGRILCWKSLTDEPGGTFTDLSLRGLTACGLRLDGSIPCWGDDEYGTVSDAPEGVFYDVSVGDFGACAISEDRVVCWGLDDYGQASDAPEGRFTSVSLGYRTACALDEDDALFCWGWDETGQRCAGRALPCGQRRRRRRLRAEEARR